MVIHEYSSIITYHPSYWKSQITSSITPNQRSKKITIVNGNKLPIANHGKGTLNTPNCKLQLCNLLHVPNIAYNLLSISHLIIDIDVNALFDKNGYKIKGNQTNQLLHQGPFSKGLYMLNSHNSITSASSVLIIHTSNTIKWHKRLGHPHHKIICLISYQNKLLNILFIS